MLTMLGNFRLDILLIIFVAYHHTNALYECGTGIEEVDGLQSKASAHMFLSHGTNSPTFPWNVILKRKGLLGGQIAGMGTLLQSKVSNGSDIILTSGSSFSSETPDPKDYAVCFGRESEDGHCKPVKQIIVIPYHPSYDESGSSFAIVRTVQEVTYTKNIIPACVPTSDVDAEWMSNRCFVSGIETHTSSGNFRVVKSQIRVPSSRECSSLLAKPIDGSFELCGSTLKNDNIQYKGSSLVCFESVGDPSEQLGNRFVVHGVLTTLPKKLTALSRGYQIVIFGNIQSILFYIKDFLQSTGQTQMPLESQPEMGQDESALSDGEAANRTLTDFASEVPDDDEAVADHDQDAVLEEAREVPLLEVEHSASKTEAEDSSIGAQAEYDSVAESDMSSQEWNTLISTANGQSLSALFRPKVDSYIGYPATRSPWTVLFVKPFSTSSRVACAGSILETGHRNHSDLILTSTNCVWKKHSQKNQVIVTDSFQDDAFSFQEIQRLDAARNIAKFLLRPVIVKDEAANDSVTGVAVIRLSKPYIFDGHTLPIVPLEDTNKNMTEYECFVAGRTDSGQLLQTKVWLLSKVSCAKQLGYEFRPKAHHCGFTAKHAFQPTDGSPLVCRVGNKWKQYGMYLAVAKNVEESEYSWVGKAGAYFLAYYFILPSYQSFIEHAMKHI